MNTAEQTPRSRMSTSIKGRIAQLLVAAVSVGAIVALVPATGAAAPSASAAREEVSSHKVPAAVQKKVQRLRRDARISRPKRTAASTKPSTRPGSGTAVARAASKSYIDKGCTPENGGWNRWCVWTQLSGTVVDGYIVQYQYWNGSRYVPTAQWFCGSGWGGPAVSGSGDGLTATRRAGPSFP